MTAFSGSHQGQRAEIVGAIFPGVGPSECYRLIDGINDILDREQPDKTALLPVAFFSHLRSTLLDEDLWKEVSMPACRAVDEIIRMKSLTSR
jgi:hypothetical protein